MGYYLLYSVIRVLSFIPLKILLFISDCFYFPVYYLLQYRRKTVRKNLENSFPEKSKNEIISIEKKFYRHFCDLIIETIKMAGFSHQKFMEHLVIHNHDILLKLEAERRSFILVSGHMGNWEWISPMPALQPDVKFYPIYHPLANITFDKFMITLRSRFKGIPLPMKETLRTVVNCINKKELFCIWFICDQTPPKEGAYWTNFLNQDTPVFMGPEKIARKFNLPVVFLNMHKVKRGYYHIDLTMIEENPSGLSEFSLTEKHVRFLESKIREHPEQWLWSHRRWKHTRIIEK